MRALIFVLLLPASALANSLLLDSTSKALELTTSTTASTDYVVSYADHTSSAFTPGMSQGNVASATTTVIVSAPAASTQRQVKWVSVVNKGTTTQTVTLKLDVSGTEYNLTSAITLAASESLRLDGDGEVYVFDRNGRRREQAVDTTGYYGLSVTWLKTGTASEAVGNAYAFQKDSGVPGAWVPGTPGLNGATLDCSTTSGAATAGAPYIANPATGGNYLTTTSFSSTTAHHFVVADLLWYNTGLVVTTTTAQNITFPTPVSRDLNGGASGHGVLAAIYVTTATTNGSAVTNTTISYTDQDGNAGNTGTIPSFPATAVAGTFVPFFLAAGDTGIRSIESITLGTSYVTGAISLVTFRPLIALTNPLANMGSTMGVPSFNPGIRLWNGTCLFPYYTSSATTATTTHGTVSVLER